MSFTSGPSLICGALAGLLVAMMTPWRWTPDWRPTQFQQAAIEICWLAGVLMTIRAIPAISPKPLPPGWQQPLLTDGAIVTAIATGLYAAAIWAFRRPRERKYRNECR